MPGIRRREFVTLLGGAAAIWPLAARAQQSAMPVVGFLHPTSLEAPIAARISPGPQGNRIRRRRERSIEYRWANSQLARLPELMADLCVGAWPYRHVSRLRRRACGQRGIRNDPDCLRHGARPCEAGIGREPRASRRQSDRNQFLMTELAAKRLGLLRELCPPQSGWLFSSTRPKCLRRARCRR